MFDDDGIPKEPPQLSRALEIMRSVWAVDHAARHLSRMMETHLGISGPQRLVLRVVGQHPRVSAGALAGLLHLDASTLTTHLQRLELDGLIERRAATDDARRAELSLTARGRRFDVATPGTVEAAVEAALSRASPESVRGVALFLGDLEAALRVQARACTDGAAKKPRRGRLK